MSSAKLDNMPNPPRAGSALASAVEVFMPAFEEIAAMVVVCDVDGCVVACNQTFAEQAGRSKDAIVGCGVDDLNVPTDLQRAPLGQGAGFVLFGAPDGAVSDLEDRLAEAQRLMDVGQLAAGVAHELKNPLTSILNYADYLLDKYRGQFFEQRDSERLQRIVDGVERMDRFVRDLLQIARSDEMIVQERVAIHEAVDSAVRLCAITLDSGSIELTSELGDEGVHVRGVRSQLEQVFVNLITNAADAMPADGGTIRVGVEVADDRVVCRVSDDGEGMSEATRQRIFEPFFTTRGDDNGTGLGLALVRTILERHQGGVEVESAPGDGTTFIVTLPLAG